MTTHTLITTADAARALGISTRTVARRAASGQLPYALKLDGIRGHYLFDPAVIAHAAKQRQALKRARVGAA